jgi:hypothetical protein
VTYPGWRREPTVDNVTGDAGCVETTAVRAARNGTDTDVLRAENAELIRTAVAARPSIGGCGNTAGT